MEWDSVRFFLAVARQGGLTGATRELGVSISTVSRNLNQLEESIGVPLFIRHSTGFTLTDHGESLFRRAEEAEDAILSFESLAIGQQQQTSGVVRLATAENIATHFIIPALPRFYKQYPSITLDLITSIPSINMAKREADVALRLARPEHGNVLVRKLGTQQWAFYGSQELQWKKRELLNKDNCSHYSFIFWTESLADLLVPKWLNEVIKPGTIPLYCSSLYTCLCAAKAGIGIALLPCFIGDANPDLDYIPFDGEAIAQDIWLAVNRDVRTSGRVSVVVDFLEELVEENQAVFRGKHFTHTSVA